MAASLSRLAGALLPPALALAVPLIRASREGDLLFSLRGVCPAAHQNINNQRPLMLGEARLTPMAEYLLI